MEPVILYNNKIKDATVTSTSSATNHDVDYLKDNKTYTSWKATASGTNNIFVDFGSSTLVSAWGIAVHNLDGADLTLYTSSDNSLWFPVSSQFQVSGDSSILKLSGDTERYWKLEIVSSNIPQIGVLYLGEYFTFDYPPESPVIPNRESIVAQSETSNGGHLLGTDVRYYSNTAQFTFKNITRTFYTNKLKVFWDEQARLLRGFFFAWDLTNRADDIFYCKISEDSKMQEPLSLLNYVDEVNLNLQLLA